MKFLYNKCKVWSSSFWINSADLNIILRIRKSVKSICNFDRRVDWKSNVFSETKQHQQTSQLVFADSWKRKKSERWDPLLLMNRKQESGGDQLLRDLTKHPSQMTKHLTGQNDSICRMEPYIFIAFKPF